MKNSTSTVQNSAIFKLFLTFLTWFVLLSMRFAVVPCLFFISISCSLPAAEGSEKDVISCCYYCTWSLPIGDF